MAIIVRSKIRRLLGGLNLGEDLVKDQEQTDDRKSRLDGAVSEIDNPRVR